jgi:uncharacterized protein (TIGR03089 family)
VTDGVVDLLTRRIATDPAQPFVTVVADAGRVELSAVTIGNWIAKTAGLLRDDLMLSAGDVIDIDLPLGWPAIAWQHAVWRAGMVVGFGEPSAALLVRDEFASLDGAKVVGANLETVLVGRHLLGLPITPEPTGAIDWSSAARPMPDRFGAPKPALDKPAVARFGQTLSHGELVALGRDLATRWAVGSGARALLAATQQPVDALLGAALVPTVTNGSLLLWNVERPPTKADLDSEGVTTVAH